MSFPKSFSKKQLLDEICLSIQADLDVLMSSAIAAREAATHDESKAEDKYDTRGLEASYLAGAHAKRATELQKLINYFKQLEILSFESNKPIEATALVKIQSEDSTIICFVLPRSTGITLESQGLKVQVINPQSPIGSELMTRTEGEYFEIERSGPPKEYKILAVL